jgi:subtilase family serine protease
MAVRARLVAVIAIGAGSAAVLALAGLPASAAARRAEPRFVALPGSAAAISGGPAGARRAGPYASARMAVELALAPRDPAGLTSELRSAYTHGSGGYHRWLARGQFDARYSPAASARAAVTAYLRSAGLRVVASASPFLVRAVGPSDRVESAFRTSLGSYRSPSGASYFANSGPVRLPASIAPAVLGVIGLTSTIRLHPMLMRRAGSARLASGKHHASCEASYPSRARLFRELASGKLLSSPNPVGYGAGPGCSGLTPAQVNAAYGAPHAGPRGKGAGVTLGLFELSAYRRSDITTWARHYYGPRYRTHLVDISVDGGSVHPRCPAGDRCPRDINGYSGDIEVAGDIEMDLAVAPDARRIEVYDAPADTTGQTTLDEYAAIASQDTADVVSASWATCENDLSAGYVQAENEIFEQMALQGQSMFSGSGDWGIYECVASLHGPFTQNLLDPSSQPWVTGAGGTSLESYNPGKNQHPSQPPPGTETVWNVDNLCGTQARGPANDNKGGPFWCLAEGASGGGFSQYWGRPFYQSGPGVANPAYPSASGSKNSSGVAECVLAPAGAPCREDPDVSANADPNTGFAVYCTGTAKLPESTCATFTGGELVPGWFEGNGTSLAGPLWAAIIADRDGYTGHRAGNINPWVYFWLRLDPARFFTDITGTGPRQAAATSNGVFPVTPGYDMATGVGSPRMAALITGR